MLPFDELPPVELVPVLQCVYEAQHLHRGPFVALDLARPPELSDREKTCD